MLGTWPYCSPSTHDLKSSPASRGSCRSSRKSGFRELQKIFGASKNIWSGRPDAALPLLGVDDADGEAVLGVGGDGELGELRLLHADVPVAVDLAAPEPLLPVTYIILLLFIVHIYIFAS